MEKQHLVVLSGAGISAESGIQTFRGSGGLWEGYDIMEVASPEGWAKNPELVLEFYNKRRENIGDVKPNLAHQLLAKLESDFRVSIVTQNIDNLHERGGSSNILHLHGEITKARSTKNENLVYDIGTKAIKLGDTCEAGSQLRPHIVWFGEAVPLIEQAALICQSADIFVVIGTSMAVYPAASLIHYVADHVPKYIIDPNLPETLTSAIPNLYYLQHPATIGMEKLRERLSKQEN